VDLPFRKLPDVPTTTTSVAVQNIFKTRNFNILSIFIAAKPRLPIIYTTSGNRLKELPG